MTGSLQVLKLGGELLETPEKTAALAPAIATMAGGGPLLVVHGGGREIDAECARRNITKVAVDGLRVTDAATLDAVVAVLAGTINTRLVAALGAAGARAVGLTGADARVVAVRKAAPHAAVDGRVVDLGLVGTPVGEGPPALLTLLLEAGYVPVVACLGVDEAGTVYNVNADTLASHLAVACGAARLLVAGGTPGVLDKAGEPIEEIDLAGLDGLITDGTATAGMIAKLVACRDAHAGGVAVVRIVDGRSPGALHAWRGTRIRGGGAPPRG